jgi:HlyD family secretion protein|nr:MAG: efflux RND transporter periplasmic adaptor subunit [Pseudomonadota bacterium]
MNPSVRRIGRPVALALALLVIVALAWRAMLPPTLPAWRVDAAPLVQQVVATGRVITTSRSQVGSEITATVVERHVREGDKVEPGQLLVTLRAPDLAAAVREAEAALQKLIAGSRPEAEARLAQAEAQLAQASREARRREDLFNRQLIAREALEQALEAESVARAAAEAARASASTTRAGGSEEAQLRERLAAARGQLARTEIRAQRAGTVLTRNVEPGDLVQPGRVLFTIAHTGQTEIEVPVDEKNLSVLAEGQQAVCLADAWPDRPFTAVVDYIAPGIDADRGTVTLRLRVDPVPDFLRQDMTVTVNIETGRRDAALVVPNDALLPADAQGRRAVLAVRDGRVVRVPVATGLRSVTMTEITSGLAAGDEVLADGARGGIAEGARVRTRLLGEVPATTASAPPSTGRELPVQLD